MINESSKEHNALLGNASEQKQEKSTNLFWIFSRINAMNLFYLLAFGLLSLLGTTTVFLTVSGIIQPLWLATLLSMLGSISTMFGLYGIYSLLHNANTMKGLVKQAIHRVINAKN